MTLEPVTNHLLLQLAAYVALLVASKMSEVSPLRMKSLANLTGRMFTPTQVGYGRDYGNAFFCQQSLHLTLQGKKQMTRIWIGAPTSYTSQHCTCASCGRLAVLLTLSQAGSIRWGSSNNRSPNNERLLEQNAVATVICDCQVAFGEEAHVPL